MSLFKKIIKSKSGFSLAEVMVAAGMLGVLSLGVTQLMQNMNKSSNRLQQDAELLAVENLIVSNLMHKDNCTATLREHVLTGNLNAAAADVDIIYRARSNWSKAFDVIGRKSKIIAADDGTFTTADSVYGSGASRVRILSMDVAGFYTGDDQTFEKLSDDGNYNPASANAIQSEMLTLDDDGTIAGDLQRNSGPAVLRIVVSKQVTIDAADSDEDIDAKFRKKAYGARTITKFIPLTVTTNAAGQIQECSASSTDYNSDDACGQSKLIHGELDQGECKNINFKNINVGDTAVKITGNTEIEADGGDDVNLSVTASAGNSTLTVSGEGGDGLLTVMGDGSGTKAKLGIGTDSPDDELHVYSSTNSSAIFERNTSQNSTVEFKNVDGSMFAGLDGNENFGIGTSANLLGDGILTVAADGTVGIGTTSPSNKLHVEGIMIVTTNIGIGTTAPAVELDVVGDATITGNVGIGSATPAAKLDVVGDTLITGNVGIGTATPSKKLHVEGEAYVNGLITSDVLITQITNGQHVPTVNWVTNHVGEALAPSGAVAAVVGYIDNMDRSQAYEAIKSAICQSININGTQSGNAACVFNDHRVAVLHLNAITKDLSFTDMNGRIKHVNLSSLDCATMGNCNTVSANSAICIGQKCRTRWATSCSGADEYMFGISSTGAALCADFSFIPETLPAHGHPANHTH